jgi:hypothetical protein
LRNRNRKQSTARTIKAMCRPDRYGSEMLVEFVFDCPSPYACLASTQLERLDAMEDAARKLHLVGDWLADEERRRAFAEDGRRRGWS